ncbi:MAG: iron-containing alcohol dehydrogenase [Gemmatimonadales bacterium]|nr:MAG: iron-containing alcohol dehydrogenase [Gemmatimonadales bacterium]
MAAGTIEVPGVRPMKESGARRMVMPSRYVQGPGVIRELGLYVCKFGSKPYVVGGRRSLAKVRARVQASLLHSKVPMVGFDDGVVECTRAKIDEVAVKAMQAGADVIIGCGGGKSVDTAKAVGEKLNLPVITVPTQCATNADQMADAVIFTEDHRFLEDLYLERAPLLVLVDTEILVDAPVKYLVQGMGDALAGGFEKPAYAASQRAKKAPDQATSAAVDVNLRCYSTLMEHGIQAKKDAEAGRLTDSVELVIEAIKLMSGFGFGGGGCAAAHAVHNGLTVVPGMARSHGEIVAFGTLVQMFLEGRTMGEIERVMRWCMELGLPTRFDELGELDKSALPAAAEKACDPSDTMSNMPFPVTPEMVLDAMGEVDRVASELSCK